MQTATQEQINSSPIARQLWCIRFPDEEGAGMGVIKMQKDFLIAMDDNSEKKDTSNYVCQFDSDYEPKDEEDWMDFKMNSFIDTNIVTIVPNMFLFLEALFEDYDSTVADYHLSVYKANLAFIDSDKKMQETYPSIKRVDQPFTWTANEEGYLFNHLGRQFMYFEDVKLAKFVALAASQYYSIHFSVMQEQLLSLGMGTGFMIGGGGLGLISNRTAELSYNAYLEMKQLIADMNWDLHAEVLALNSTLEEEYSK